MYFGSCHCWSFKLFIKEDEMKPLTLLKAFLSGSRVTLQGSVYAMTEDFELVCVATKESGEEAFLKCHCTIKEFCKLAERLTEEEFAVVCMSNTLKGKPTQVPMPSDGEPVKGR